MSDRSPLLVRRGRLRHQENFGEAHLSAADGVVAHKSKFRCERRLFLMAAPYRACAGSAPRPLQQGGFAAFSLCRVHPSSRGGDYARPKSILEKTSNDTSVSLWFRTYITRLLISPCGYGIHHGSKAPQHQHIERKIALITHDNPIGLAACTNQRGGREFDRLPQRLQLF